MAENWLFGRNSAADCPISVTFCTGQQNSMELELTWHKLAILKIVKLPYCDEKHLILIKFGTQQQTW